MRRVGDVFLASNAVVTADVTLGRFVSLWYGVVVRGDVAPVTVGDGTNLQDGVIAHCDAGFPNDIEADVVVGHAAVLHGRWVGSGTLVGIGARLLGGTEIGEECIVAAGAVVPPGMRVPPRSVVMGVPGKVVRPATADEIAHTRVIAERYRELARRYADGDVAWPYGKPV
jgi:carbonic anhydrase/acetyltransferase-like protein (isoleucine patch superfamily)